MYASRADIGIAPVVPSRLVQPHGKFYVIRFCGSCYSQATCQLELVAEWFSFTHLLMESNL